MRLYKELKSYVNSGILPLHMPGHKRNPAFHMDNPYSIDITEVEGMDDLHDPHGIILDLMRDCSDFYGTGDTYLLVNGSTSGNMIAIAACCPRGSVLLADEVCHRSVAHAADILGLELVPIKRQVDFGERQESLGEPDKGLSIAGKASASPDKAKELDKKISIAGPISPEALAAQLDELASENRLPAAVIITSPSYEGVVSDIVRIADIVHERDIPLIVDEAHGAHLTLAKVAGEKMEDFSEKAENLEKKFDTDEPKNHAGEGRKGLLLNWPEPAISQGADLVVESLHKTLPCLTQTALLHRCSERVERDTISYYHDVFLTSSPSYVLMSSIDQCMEWQRSDGVEAFIRYDKALESFYNEVERLGNLVDLSDGRDPSKIVLIGDEEHKTSEILQLLRRNKIEPELVRDTHIVLMTSPADTDSAFDRLAKCLFSYD